MAQEELAVITQAKNLAFYVLDITEKSPKQFRVVFANRLQNHALDILELLIEANFTQIETDLKERKRLQKQAYTKLKLLSNIAFMAMQSQAIKITHYTNISKYVEEVSALISGWGKSDSKRAEKNI